MSNPRCARNLPQHSNGCRCVARGTSTEADLTLGAPLATGLPDSTGTDAAAAAARVLESGFTSSDVNAALARYNPDLPMLKAIAADDAAIDAYNEKVPYTEALTPERIAFLRSVNEIEFVGDRGFVYGRDREDYRVSWYDDGPVRVTECCGASATGTEYGIACRSCYGECDDGIGTNAEMIERPAGWVRWDPSEFGESDREEIRDKVAVALTHLNSKRYVSKPRHWDAVVVYVDAADGRIAIADESAFADRRPDAEASVLPPRAKANKRGQILARVEHDGRIESVGSSAYQLRVRPRPDGAFDIDERADTTGIECTATPGCVLVRGHMTECTPTRVTKRS